MKRLMSPQGRARLEEVMRRKPLLAFDFDGTLAPIVDDPREACVPDAVESFLRALAETLPIAVISGRSAADVAQRLRFPVAHVIGSHGADDPLDPPPMHVLAELDRLRARLRSDHDMLMREGIMVEDKGLSLALHFRRAADPQRASLFLWTMLEDHLSSLRVFGGKMVVNVTARETPDKGGALRKVVARSGRDVAVFVGDDVNDEPAFACAAPDWLTVKVAAGGGASRAGYFLDGISEMPQMLDWMLRGLDAP